MKKGKRLLKKMNILDVWMIFVLLVALFATAKFIFFAKNNESQNKGIVVAVQTFFDSNNFYDLKGQKEIVNGTARSIITSFSRIQKMNDSVANLSVVAWIIPEIKNSSLFFHATTLKEGSNITLYGNDYNISGIIEYVGQLQ